MSFEERKLYEFFLVDVEARKLPSGIKTVLTWKTTETGDQLVELYHMHPDGKPGNKMQELLTKLNISLADIRRNMTIYSEVNRSVGCGKSELIEWSLAYCTTASTCDRKHKSGDLLHETVLGVLALKLTRAATLEKLESLGSEYVREYRAMQKQSGGST